MASPQTDLGYTRIANELLTALSRTELRGSEFMIVLAVITKTYGWNKKQDQISITQFEKLTGMDRKSCTRAISRLVTQKVLGSVKGDPSHASTYWVQKDYDKWDIITSGNCDSSLGRGTDDTRTRGTVVPKLGARPYNTKKTLKTIKDKGSKSQQTRFVPPALVELNTFLKERNSPIDAEAFIAYYESKGWKIGNSPMKSWKAAVITWEKRDMGIRVYKKPKDIYANIDPMAI